MISFLTCACLFHWVGWNQHQIPDVLTTAGTFFPRGLKTKPPNPNSKGLHQQPPTGMQGLLLGGCDLAKKEILDLATSLGFGQISTTPMGNRSFGRKELANGHVDGRRRHKKTEDNRRFVWRVIFQKGKVLVIHVLAQKKLVRMVRSWLEYQVPFMYV